MKNDIGILFLAVAYIGVMALMYAMGFFFIGYGIGEFICKYTNWVH